MPSFLPPKWAKTVIPVETRGRTGNYQTVGSGVLVEWDEMLAFVTARHVLRDSKNMYLSYNELDGGVAHIPVATYKMWWANAGIRRALHYHPDRDVDLVVLPCVLPNADVTTIPGANMAFLRDIDESQEILFLGFPLGIKQVDQVKAIVRGGLIALKQDNGTFLIDANVFPGNSGGPVFLRPDLADLRVEHGEPLLPPPRFAGVISAYLPYTDVATSAQTGNTRITFEENSGLGLVCSADQIVDIMGGKTFRTSWRHIEEWVEELARKADEPEEGSDEPDEDWDLAFELGDEPES